MEHLLAAWPKVTQQLKGTKRVLLFSDYDGTLTPIVESPELANLPESVRQLLRALAHERRLVVGIISGRALADLKKRVGVNGIIYAGNHGLEIEGPGVSFVSPIAEEIKPIFRIMHQVLSRSLRAIRGVLVENKGLTLSIHYRLADASKAGEVKGIVERTVGSAQALGKVRITPGKKVYEVRPANTWDKGKAIKLLMKKYGKGGRESGLLPIYLGDDLTDEDGFKVIEKYGNGISIFIGEANRNTAARYYLKSTDEAGKFLSVLLEYARRGPR